MNTPAPGKPEATGFVAMLEKLGKISKMPLSNVFPISSSHKINSKTANAKPGNAYVDPKNAKSAKGGRKYKTRKSSKRTSRKRSVH
jgi:hypothetical protein